MKKIAYSLPIFLAAMLSGDVLKADGGSGLSWGADLSQNFHAVAQGVSTQKKLGMVTILEIKDLTESLGLDFWAVGL